MGPALLIAAGTARRLLSPTALLLALLAGAGAGLAVRHLPAPELAPEVYAGLVRVLAAILVLPLAAAVPTADRAGGFELLVALRPQSSLQWTAGRMLGSVLAMGGLVLLLASTARWIGGSVAVPERLVAQRMDAHLAHPLWRFPLPAGTRGPFDLQLDVASWRPGRARLQIEVTRGDGVALLSPAVSPRARLAVPLPDLWPERGDLFVTLRAPDGLLLEPAPPQLVIGTVPLGRSGLPLPTSAAAGLALALLAALAAACAFHFETACLAGLLALQVELPAGLWPWGAVLGVLLLVGTLGTALQRRAALP